MQVQSLALLSGLRIQSCYGYGVGWQLQLYFWKDREFHELQVKVHCYLVHGLDGSCC